MNVASEIMRDALLRDLIPQLEELGRDEIVARLKVAIEIGERSYKEHPEYWEGIRLFAINGIALAKCTNKLKGLKQ